jgi:hypothetical protein
MANDQGQSDKFKNAARDLRCDKDEAEWDERLAKIAKSKPKQVPEKQY